MHEYYRHVFAIGKILEIVCLQNAISPVHLPLPFSLSGHRVTNTSQVHFYSATKYAVTAITEGVRHELRNRKSDIKITVSLVFSKSCIKLHISSSNEQEFFPVKYFLLFHY